MKVESVHNVRGRGIVVVVQRSDESAGVLVGAHLSNGERIWRVTGVETAKTLMLPPRPIGPIGLVLSGDVPPAVGDDLQVVGVAPPTKTDAPR